MRMFLYGLVLFLFTYFGVELFRRWSLKKNLLDLPNERSSHTLPTPRGGGLVIVVVVLTFFFFTAQDISLLPYFIGSIIISLISWLDDIKHIPSGIRFLVHSISALVAIYYFGYFQEIFGFQIGFGGFFITFFWIIWLTNAYNFMDGIDGIAGMQALVASIAWLFYTLAKSSNDSFLALAILFTTLGFLIHNWSPAKIFMGDVGSAFLGYTFAVIPLFILKNNPQESNVFLLAILFVWLFIFDTVFTFFRRLLNGEKVWQAHRSHLYQRLVISGFSHQSVTLIYGITALLINLLTIKFFNELKFLVFIIGFISAFGLLGLVKFYEQKSEVSKTP